MPQLAILVVTLGVFWALFVRPQQRRVREHHALVSSLGVGDEVVTAGGIKGVIRALDGDDVSLEVAPDVTLVVLRPAISRRVTDDEVDGATSDEVAAGAVDDVVDAESDAE